MLLTALEEERPFPGLFHHLRSQSCQNGFHLQLPLEDSDLRPSLVLGSGAKVLRVEE